jgi:hypothetical protein
MCLEPFPRPLAHIHQLNRTLHDIGTCVPDEGFDMQEEVRSDIALGIDRADIIPGGVRKRAVQLGGLTRLIVFAGEQLDPSRMLAAERLDSLDGASVMIAQRDDDLTGPVTLPNQYS